MGPTLECTLCLPAPAENFGVIPTTKSDLIPAWMWHSRCRTQTQVSPKRILQASRVSRGQAATGLAAFAVLSCGACERPSSRSSAEPVYFSETDSAYVISNVEARLGGFGDDRIAFGSIVDVEKIPSGWAVLDGINRHIVFVDGDLNPVRIVGGVGEGPGEFQAPGQLAMAGDTIAVLEMGSGGRVSYLGPQGDFLRVSSHVGHPVESIAIHPDSGRFFPILSREY